MKTIGKFFGGIIIFVWLILAIFVTIWLLSYNDFQVTTFGKNSLIVVDSDEMEPEYLEGDLLIVKRNSDNKIDVGDSVFYYNSSMDSNVLIYHGTIEAKQSVTHDETTYTIEGKKVSGKYVIGKMDNAKSYHNLGTFLAIMTSRWGFMFLVIFPTLFAVIYEIIMIVEAAKNKDEDQEE